MTQREFLAALFIRDLLGKTLSEVAGAFQAGKVLGEIELTVEQSAIVRRAVAQAYVMADACLAEVPLTPTVIKKENKP